MRTAARLFGVPIALVSLVDEDRQWFKAKEGLDISETPRAVSFCTHAIQEPRPLVVTDATRDPRFADSPLVTDYPRMRFYAGMPIRNAEGLALGTLCIADNDPRSFDEADELLLIDLARWAQLELQSPERRFENLFGRAPVALWDEDFSAVGAWLDDLRESGVDDLRAYIRDNPDQMIHAASLVRVRDVNQAAVEMFDAPEKAALIGSLPLQAMGRKRHPAFVEQLIAIWEDRDLVQMESIGHTFSGSPLECLLRWSASRTNAGLDLSNVVVAITDLTEQREMAQRLTQSELRYQNLFEGLPVGVFRSTEAGALLDVNPAMVSILGYPSPEALLAKPVTDIYLDSSDREVLQTQLAADGVVLGAEIETRRFDGSIIWARVSMREIPGTDPDRVYEGTVEDMTARKRAEEALQQSKEALEKTLRSKDEFIASVSHELRTPLTAVVGFARLLQADGRFSAEEDLAEMIQTIVDQGTDLTNLVEDLLVAEKAKTDAIEVVSVPTDLKVELAKVLETLDRKAQGSIRIEGGGGSAMADPGRVRQILRNLITNGLLYGGGEIQVRVEADDDTVSVVVLDSGPGIPAADVERVFLPYERGHESRGTTSSMGLGLAISRDLARRMGGDVTYDRVGGQTVFELRLPAAGTI